MSTLTDISTIITECGLTVDSVFVPWSQSRNAKERNPSLNWRVTIKRNDRAILITDYSAGLSHCPASKASVNDLGSAKSVMRHKHIRFECEHGYATDHRGANARATGKALQPNPTDVLYSIVQDSAAIDYGSFEEWADNLGYNVDSRKAEKIYQACIEIALKMRAALGDANMQKLRDAFQDY